MLAFSEHACRHPRAYLRGASLASLLFILLVAIPSLWPGSVPLLPPLQIDTDPENMLDSQESVRVAHDRLKAQYSLYDMLVIGVVQPMHPQGVFNQATLTRVYQLTEYAKTLVWQENEQQKGVIAVDLIAPSTVDNIEQAGLGAISFDWLMASPPATEEAALQIADKALGIPFLKDTLVSPDRQALALYVPITEKKVSYQVANALREKISSLGGDEQYYITGLPVAQDQFGVEMFQQMAISAPAAMALIFVLMWLFFRNIRLIVSPMIVAMVAVIVTMALLIITGNTVHIMSSMIPIFIMPIAVLDAVHILSDFFDRYAKNGDRYQTLREVMEELSAPMLFTSLTTSIGFASLALTPIPPVQVFGLFVGLGVLLAWLLTITLVPAYIMRMPPEAFDRFGLQHAAEGAHPSLLSRLLQSLGRGTFVYARLILVSMLVLGAAAYYGIQQIRINDNPVKWFEPAHEIRVADRELNQRFAGTYMAYLSFNVPQTADEEERIQLIEQLLLGLDEAVALSLRHELERLTRAGAELQSVLQRLIDFSRAQAEGAEDDRAWEAWDEALLALEQLNQPDEPFKNPELLNYIASLQEHLLLTGFVGKSNGLPDLVKTVHRELFLGAPEAFRVPDSSAAVAQTILTYQSSHRPQDLWHFVTPDYQSTNLWIQLKSGDNQDMKKVVAAVAEYMAQHPAPVVLQTEWFGLTYINLVWQDKMVSGMAKAFLGSFVIVLAMMIVLFRSFWWGLLSMVPLTVTIGVTYGVIGLIGKDYDMPVAVLSSLSLGLAVDYAIHFIARSRQLRAQHNSWQETLSAVYQEPARAITRNIIVIGCGFLPLLLAPLVPYQTVGVFISTILVLAGLTTLVVLPALIRLFERTLFAGVVRRSTEESHETGR